MATPPVRKDMLGFLQDLAERLGLVERRLSKGLPANSAGTITEGAGIEISGAGSLASPYLIGVASGTTAERNVRYPVPATDPDRVALANARPLWFNTELGWEESYYAPTGLSGLTVQRLQSGVPADWYPTGLGPECILQPTSGTASVTGTYLGGWNGNVVRRGGAAWFTPDPLGIVINKPGTWDLSAWTIQQSGTGIATFALRVLDAPGTTILAVREHAAESLQGAPYLTPAEYRMTSVTKAVTQCLFATIAGSLNVHQTAAGSPGVRGQMIARYLRPPFLSD